MSIQHGDILLSDGKIVSRNGDLIHGDAQEQHLGALLDAHTGNFRRYPTLGANLDLDIDAPLNSRLIASKIASVLFLDGWSVGRLNISTNNLERINITVADATKTTDETSSLI